MTSADELRRRCVALHDLALRLAVVRDAIGRGGARLALDLVRGAMDAPDDVGLLATLVLCDESFGSVRDEAARLAEAEEDTRLVEVCRRRPWGEGPADLRVPDFGVGRPLPLGERKSLARRRDRNVLARVLRDPHPDVVRILLANPALTEPDVLRLAARRPVDPRVLMAILFDLRWTVRPGIRRALVQNPWTPLEVAMLLVPHLNRAELAELERSADLREPLRELAAVLRHRGPRGREHDRNVPSGWIDA